MKLQMKREALEKLNRRANEMGNAPTEALLAVHCARHGAIALVCAQFVTVERFRGRLDWSKAGNWL